MSLINDALKRANQAQKQPARPRPPLSPLQPVESIRRPAAWTSYLVPVLLVVVLATAGWFLHAWWQSRQSQSLPVVAAVSPPPRPSVTTAKPTVIVPTPIASPEAPLVPTPAIKVNTNLVVRGNPSAQPGDLTAVEATKAAPVETPVVGNTPVAPATNAVAVAPEKVVTKPAFPEMRLQGIFYRVAKPSVLINSRTLFINEKVDGVKVIAIDRQSVTLEFEGERKVLSLD